MVQIFRRHFFFNNLIITNHLYYHHEIYKVVRFHVKVIYMIVYMIITSWYNTCTRGPHGDSRSVLIWIKWTLSEHLAHYISLHLLQFIHIIWDSQFYMHDTCMSRTNSKPKNNNKEERSDVYMRIPEHHHLFVLIMKNKTFICKKNWIK